MADTPAVSPSARIFNSYIHLASAAEALNAVSDELAKPIATLDAALKRLNLGITAWVRIKGLDDDGQGNFWGEDLGYAKVAGRWGVALRTRRGNHNVPPDLGDYEEWLFNDAPRSLRIDAIDKIPELVDKLVASSEKTARKIKTKATEATELAIALDKAAKDLAEERNKSGKR